MCTYCPRKFLRKNLLISCLDINHNLERYRVIFILTQLAIETSDLISGPDMTTLNDIDVKNTLKMRLVYSNLKGVVYKSFLCST